MKFENEKKITFDDVLLVPQFSEISSREEVDLSHGKLKLKTPIISANMDSVTGFKMSLAMSNMGGCGIIHRYLNTSYAQDLISTLQKFNKETNSRIGISVGIKESYIERHLLRSGLFSIVCVDVAHGYSTGVINRVLKLKNEYDNALTVIAGNVATYDGACHLFQAGADIVKVGIGPGSHCTTRIVTGHGYPQLSAIIECASAAYNFKREIIADGGIRNSGDIAKAIAAGADYVMIGRLFAGTDEAEGEKILIDGKYYKMYRGMASQDVYDKINKKRRTPEGVASLVPYIGSVEDVFLKLRYGLQSALSYSGAKNIKEFKKSAIFIRVTDSTKRENIAHGV